MVNVPIVMGIAAVSISLAGLGFAIAERRALRKAKADYERAVEMERVCLEVPTVSKTAIDPPYREISHGDTRELAGMRH